MTTGSDAENTGGREAKPRKITIDQPGQENRLLIDV